MDLSISISISLSPGIYRTKRVNVVIKNVDGVSYNDKVIAPIPKVKCRFYTLFSSIRLMCLLYVLRHLIIEILGSGYTIYFMDSIYNVITLIITNLYLKL